MGRVKLSMVAEVPLPQGVDALHLPKTSVTAEDGALWGVVDVKDDDEWQTWIIRADEEGLTHHGLSASDVEDVFNGQAIVDVGGGSVAVVLSTDVLRVLDPGCSVLADLVIEGANELRQAELEITPSTARGERGGAYVLRLGSRFGAHTLVPLRLDLAPARPAGALRSASTPPPIRWTDMATTTSRATATRHRRSSATS
jgi:hypothetical protein